MAGHVARMEAKENAGFWWGNCDEMRPLGGPCCIWKENIKMGLKWDERDSSCLRIGTSGRLL